MQKSSASWFVVQSRGGELTPFTLQYTTSSRCCCSAGLCICSGDAPVRDVHTKDGRLTLSGPCLPGPPPMRWPRVRWWAWQHRHGAPPAGLILQSSGGRSPGALVLPFLMCAPCSVPCLCTGLVSDAFPKLVLVLSRLKNGKDAGCPLSRMDKLCGALRVHLPLGEGDKAAVDAWLEQLSVAVQDA